MRQCGYTLALAAIAVGWLGANAVAQKPIPNPKVQMPTFDNPADLAKLPMIGKWKFNHDKSTFNGSRANSDTFTWIFQTEKDGLRQSIYDVYPQDKPNRSYFIKPNGQEFPDPHGPGLDQTVSWWPINRNTMFREVKEHGKPIERVIYQVSADGKTFTAQTWSPNMPNPRGQSNLMSFDRVEGATASR